MPKGLRLQSNMGMRGEIQQLTGKVSEGVGSTNESKSSSYWMGTLLDAPLPPLNDPPRPPRDMMEAREVTRQVTVERRV